MDSCYADAVRPSSSICLAWLALSLSVACGSDGAPDEGAENAYGGEGVDAPVTASDLTAAHAVSGLTSMTPVTKQLGANVAALLPADRILASGSRLTAVRSLSLEGTPAYVVVDERSMRSFVVKRADFDAGTTTAVDTNSASFVAALRARAQSPITRMNVAADATEMTVTIDMCQSSKPWDVKLFDWLRQVSTAIGKPVPVGVAMTGGWAKAHGTQLAQLLSWQKSKQLDIVWVNHSYTHPLNCNAAKTSCAFLTASSVDMKSEVLKNEELLLAQGAVPSSLFRFPGLVHNQARMSELNKLSLFALDADTWLAKGQPTHDGSLILVHGNGNEPPGITKFMNLASQNRWLEEAKAGRLQFVSPLRGIVATAE